MDRPDAPKDSESVAFLQTRRAIDLSRSSTCKIRTTLGEERTLNFTIDFLATLCDETEHLLDVILEPLFIMKLAISTHIVSNFYLALTFQGE